MIFDFLTPDFFNQAEPFIKGATPACLTVLGVASNWFWQIYKQRRDDRLAEEDHKATLEERKDLAEQRKQIFGSLSERVELLEEQHRFDMATVIVYQKYMISMHVDIAELRRTIDELRARLGEKSPPWPPLPPLPQPGV